MKWIKRLFTEELERRIRELEAQLKTCEEQRELINQLLSDSEEEVKRLREQVFSLEAEIRHLREEVISKLRHEVRRLELINRELKEDAEYFERRCKRLLKALSEAIRIPDIKDIAVDPVVVKPYELRLDRKGFDVLFADVEYYAFKSGVWVEILKRVWKVKHKVIEVWRKQVADCDDHALVMSAFVAMAFEEAGSDRQGAFLIVWSPTHAYNAFIDSEGQLWVYEPQSGKIKGDLMELRRRKPYNSRWLWIPASVTSCYSVTPCYTGWCRRGAE